MPWCADLAARYDELKPQRPHQVAPRKMAKPAKARNHDTHDVAAFTLPTYLLQQLLFETTVGDEEARTQSLSRNPAFLGSSPRKAATLLAPRNFIVNRLPCLDVHYMQNYSETGSLVISASFWRDRTCREGPTTWLQCHHLTRILPDSKSYPKKPPTL